MKRTPNPMYQTGARVQFTARGRNWGMVGTVVRVMVLNTDNVRVIVKFDGNKHETDCLMTALTMF